MIMYISISVSVSVCVCVCVWGWGQEIFSRFTLDVDYSYEQIHVILIV